MAIKIANFSPDVVRAGRRYLEARRQYGPQIPLSLFGGGYTGAHAVLNSATTVGNNSISMGAALLHAFISGSLITHTARCVKNIYNARKDFINITKDINSIFVKTQDVPNVEDPANIFKSSRAVRKSLLNLLRQENK